MSQLSIEELRLVIKKLLPGCSINIKDAIRSVLLQQNATESKEEEKEVEEEVDTSRVVSSFGGRKNNRMELLSEIQNVVKNKTLRRAEERPKSAVTIELSTR